MAGGLDPIDDAVVERSRRMYRLFGEGDIDFFEFVDPEIEWEVSDVLPAGGSLRGVDEVVAFLEAMDGLFEARPEPEEFIPAGDLLLVLGTWRGRVRETGVEVESPFAHVGEYRGGKLVRFRNYIDSGRILRALEGSPPARGGQSPS